MADGKSRFLALLDQEGVGVDDPLRNATPEMLQGQDPQELLSAAIKRTQLKLQGQKQAVAPQGPSQPEIILNRLRNSVQPTNERIDLDRELDERIKRSK